MRQKNKIVFLSRQFPEASKDFIMLKEEIKRISPETQVVILCKMIEKSFSEKVSYFFHMFKQMYHLATAKAAVLDGYCITACLLNHKKELKIYQLWHALGLLKNFAYSALGSKEGTTSRTAKIMRMHKGYHRIICSSPHILNDISRCYDASPEIMMPIGLPRIDYLNSEKLMAETKAEIFDSIPWLNNGKPVILYVPTLRKNKEVESEKLENSVDLSRYNLVVKKHNGYEKILTDETIINDSDSFTGLEWLSAADYVVTDYSAIIFEAMVAKKPVFLYCYDRKSYDVDRGFAQPYDSIPAPKHEKAQDIITEIDNFKVIPEETNAFLDKHVLARKIQPTKALAYMMVCEMQCETVDYEMLSQKFKAKSDSKIDILV